MIDSTSTAGPIHASRTRCASAKSSGSASSGRAARRSASRRSICSRRSSSTARASSMAAACMVREDTVRGMPSLRSLAVDTGALRSRPYRRLWTGQLVSLIGRQITVVAVPFQVYTLTHSPLAVGLLGLVQVVPLVTFSVSAGVIADRMDRRRLLLITQLCLAVCSGVLALGALRGNPPLVLIYVIVGVAAAFAAVDSPTRTAVIPNLVPRERLAGALSLNIVLFQTTLVAGPALGGLVIARLGLPVAYAIDVGTFTAALIAVALLPPQPPRGAQHEAPVAAIKRGLEFTRRQPVILGGFAMDLAAMIFGMPRALFPVLAAVTFHTGAGGLGLLYAAPGFGAVIAVLSLGGLAGAALAFPAVWLYRMPHRRRGGVLPEEAAPGDPGSVLGA